MATYFLGIFLLASEGNWSEDIFSSFMKAAVTRAKAELILITESLAVSLPVIFLLQKSLCIKISFPKVSIPTVIWADRCCLQLVPHSVLTAVPVESSGTTYISYESLSIYRQSRGCIMLGEKCLLRTWECYCWTTGIKRWNSWNAHRTSPWRIRQTGK